MANTDFAFGFLPYGPVLRQQMYVIHTAPSIGFYHGDAVGVYEENIVSAFGHFPALLYDSVIDGLDNIVGAITAIFDHNMCPVKCIPVNTVGDGSIAGFAMVADDPNQQFIVREDFDSNAIDTTEGSTNADVQSVTNNLGNNLTGKSTQMIDSTTAATTAALNCKIYGPHMLDADLVADDTPGSTGVEGCRYIVQFTEHYFGSPSVDGGKTA